MRSFVLTLAAAALIGAAGGAAAQDSPYHPKTGPGSVGYGQRQIDETHWLVKFAGDRLTSADLVEKYLLYRAAQLTVKKGGDWFATSESETSLKTVKPDYQKPDSEKPLAMDYGWGWRPHWRYWNVDPVTKQPTTPFDQRIPIRGPSVPLTRHFVASAEIMIGKGPPPEGQRVFDARRLMAQLGPVVQAPPEAPAPEPPPSH